VTRSGNQKHYQAKRDSPIFAELRRFVARTVGVVEPPRVALTLHASTIRAAFVYGSTAHGRDRTMSDIDVMVISHRLTYADVYDGLHAAEGMLGRPVNPAVI